MFKYILMVISEYRHIHTTFYLCVITFIPKKLVSFLLKLNKRELIILNRKSDQKRQL